MKYNLFIFTKLFLFFSSIFLSTSIIYAQGSATHHPSFNKNTSKEYFSVNGEPIHPKIIQALSTWMSDSGDQIVSINLYDSQNSNRFCCKNNIKSRKTLKNPIIYFSKENQEFGYQYIGRTKSGIDIICTYEYGGGSGIFESIMLLKIEDDYGIVFDKKNSIVTATRPRRLLKKLGEFTLGDRWDGELMVKGNKLFIGKDKGRFSGSKYGGQFSQNPKDSVIEINISQ